MRRFDRSTTSAVLLWFFFFGFVLLSFNAFAYEGDDLGYIDAITVNGTHFEDLDENEIVFYKEDLRNGKVIIRGLLEKEGKIPLEGLGVEVTVDGGQTWQKTKGNGDWLFVFEPELERTYEFSLRVVEQDRINDLSDISVEQAFTLKIGPFTIKGKGQLKNGRLSGSGAIDVGTLSQHLPRAMLNEAGELMVAFTNLLPDEDMANILAGEIKSNLNQTIPLFNNGDLTLRGISFTAQGANLMGTLSFHEGLMIPVIPFYNLSFGPSGISGDIAYEPYHGLKIPLVSGTYGVSVLLRRIAIHVDTAKERLSLSELDAGLNFSKAYGDIKNQALSHANGVYQWGSKAAGEVENASFTLPGTAIVIENIGGEIKEAFSGVTLIGKIKIPCYGEMIEIDLSDLSALEINTDGLSTLTPIIKENLDKSIDISGFKAQLKSVAFNMQKNIIDGSIKGRLALAQLGEKAAVDIKADIGVTGIHRLAADISANKTISIPSFADINLSKIKLSMSGQNLSVALDGGIKITNPALSGLIPDSGRDLFKENVSYFEKMGKTGVGTLKQTASSATGKLSAYEKNVSTARESISRSGAKMAGNIKNQAKETGRQAAQQAQDFAFRQLKIFKDRLELPASLSGWHPLSSPLSAQIASLSLSAESWGFGTGSKGLWAGVKGSVSESGSMMSGNARATAQFYMDGTYEILDFAANASLTIGEFTLHTDAVLSGGSVSGSGSLVSNLPMPGIPDVLKDANGKMNISVLFTDLIVDTAASMVTEGLIEFPIPDTITIPFDLADITIKKLSFSPQSALADAEILLKGFPGIEGIAIKNIALSTSGFAASGSYKPATPLSHTLFDAPNDITAVFNSLSFSFNTGTMDFSLSNLDAALELGTGFGGKTFPLGMKANLFAWGDFLSEAIDEAKNEAEAAGERGVDQAAERGRRFVDQFTIPGTGFTIKNPGGTIKLGSSPSLSLSGQIIFPGLKKSFEIDIPKATPLSINSEGISSAAKIVLDDLVSFFSLEGFPAKLKKVDFSVSNNNVEASLAADITLDAFGGFKIGVATTFDATGIDEISAELSDAALTGSIDGFADLKLISIEAGYGESGLFVDLDADLTLTHPMLKSFSSSAVADAGNAASDAKNNLEDALEDEATEVANTVAAKAAPIALRGLKIYKDALSFGEELAGWHELSPAASATIDTFQLSLKEWGAGADGSKFWLGLKGEAAATTGDVDAGANLTAQFFSDGTFRILDFDFAGEFTMGQFKLLTDASYSNNSLSGSGILVSTEPFPDLPAALKDESGKLYTAVDFQNLVLNEARSGITDGLISLDTAFDLSAKLTEAKSLAMKVRKLGFSPSGLSLDGLLSLPDIGGMVALPDLDVSGLKLGINGLSGRSVLAAVWDEATPNRIDIIKNLNVAVELTRLELILDWDKPGMNKLKFSGIDGKIDLGDLFDTAASVQQQAVSFVNNALKFEIPSVTLPDSTIGFTDLIAKLDLSSGTPKLIFESINLALPVYSETITVQGNGVSIGNKGLSGFFALNTENMPALAAFGFGAKVKKLSMSFADGAVTNGGIDLNLTLDKFHDMSFDVGGSLSESGITGLSLDIDPNNLPSITFQDMVDISLTRCVLEGDIENGISFALDPKMSIKNDVLKDTLPDFTLTGISVFKDKIETGGVELAQSLKGVSFDLGPASVVIKNFGVALSEENIALSIFGNIKLGICDSELTVKLDKSGLSVPNIKLDYNESGIKLGGDVLWKDKSFAATVEMTVAEAFDFKGNMAFGEGKKQNQRFTYWGVTVEVGTGGIPLGVLPVSIYSLGGGLAYHMKVNTAPSVPGQPAPPFFVPDADTPILFIATTKVGTSGDGGYTWHGDLTFSVDPANGRISFDGDSYALCSRSESPDNRKLQTNVEIGASPMLFHIAAQAQLFQESTLGGKTIKLFNIEGMFDILFSESDWHIYVGTKENKLSVTALEGIFHGDGYLMIDSAGLMLGVSKSFEANGSIACFYGKLYGGASFELETSVRPFYIDAEGKVWVGIEAGVKAMGSKYAIINAYADLALKIRAPNPSYARVKAKFRYSFAGGLVSGTFRMTFWMPEKPDSVSDEAFKFPLIVWMSPEDAEADISRVPQFELNTSVAPDRVLFLDDGNPYIMRLLDMSNPSAQSWSGAHQDIFVNTDDIDDVKKALRLTNASNTPIANMVGGLLDGDTIKLKPYSELNRQNSYTIKARAVLFQLKDLGNNPVELNGSAFWNSVKKIANIEEVKSHTFTTSNNENLTARTVVEKVYPNSMVRVVYPDTEVRIHYRVPSVGQSVSLNNIHTIKDPMGQTVVGNAPWQQGLATTDQIHATEEWIKFVKPATPLKPITVYKNNTTGEEKVAVISGNIERNPFNNQIFIGYNETVSDNPSAEAFHMSAPGGVASGGAVYAQAGQGMQSYGSGPSSGMAVAAGTGQEMQASGTGTVSAQTGQNIPSSGGLGYNPIIVDEYSRYTKNSFRVEVHDPEGKELLYSSRINVTENSGFTSNAEVINSSSNDSGVDPFDITMVVEGSWNEEYDVARWNSRYTAYKEQLLQAFKNGEYGFPTVPGVYLHEDAPFVVNMTLEEFDQWINIMTAIRQDVENWLLANPQPQRVGSYASEYGDVVLKFKTQKPLDWSSLEMVFDIRVGGQVVGGWAVIADRSNYRIASPPASNESIIVVPVQDIIRERGSEWDLYQFNSAGVGEGQNEPDGDASTKLYSITTGVDSGDRYTISRSGAPLFNWQFDYQRRLLRSWHCDDESGYPPVPIFCKEYASPEFIKE